VGGRARLRHHRPKTLSPEAGRCAGIVPPPRRDGAAGAGPRGPVPGGGAAACHSKVRDEHGAWQFAQADAFVFTPNVTATFRELETRIIAKLGKAAWRRTERDDDSRTIAWKLGHGIEVWLERVKLPLPDETIPRDHLHISISRPAGEAD
jgi:hypothetical protein